MALDMFGHSYVKAHKAHTCWGCGATIHPGERYWRSVVIVDSRATTLKTCRTNCEIIVDMIDQNRDTMAEAVLYPTLKDYQDGTNKPS